MHRSAISNHWTRVLAALSLAVLGAAPVVAQTTATPKLSANDVSILFPFPKNQKELANLIALSDLSGPSAAPAKSRLWSEADFTRFKEIAEGPDGIVGGGPRRIKLPPDVKPIDAWFIAGIRFDPGAPGLSKAIIDKLGQQPQIRFIAQPITKEANGKIKIHDIAAHLIFSFSMSPPKPPETAGCLPRSIPDDAAFKTVVTDLVALRDQLAAGAFNGTKVNTAGPLNVHPGLKGASAVPFKNALKALLEKHLAPPRLTSMAIMGLDAPEPWIFVAMQKVPVSPTAFAFVPVQSPTLDGTLVAQMLDFRTGRAKVAPVPANNNLNDINCRHAALQKPPLPKEGRKGVATADFINGNRNANDTRKIVDIIADPVKSHFFNTDCVSCHTDTRQAMRRVPGFKVAGVAPEVLPKDDWNVRNFGWFTSFLRGGVVEATITRRTATETAEVVNFINTEILGK